MNDDLRASLDILNAITSQRCIVLHEADFVDGETELTDNQIKQLFMILAQAAIYKKIQGSLKGYIPPFKVDKVDDKKDNMSDTESSVPMTEDELNEASIFSQMRDSFVDKFGTKGQKMAMVARNTSMNVWDKWESESISGGIPSTIETVGRWIKNKGVDDDLIDLAFTFIGVPNIQNTIGGEEPEAPEELSVVKQWLDDEMLMATAFTGALAKEFLLDKGVPENRADKMLARIGVTDGKIVSADQYKKLDAIVQKFGSDGDGEETGGEEAPTATDGETPTADWPASKVNEYILNKYEIDADALSELFGKLGTSSTDENPIGDEALSGLTDAISGGNVPEKKAGEDLDPDTVMGNAQETAKKYGKTINAAVQQGREAVKSGDISKRSELQKLGLAILTARKKI